MSEKPSFAMTMLIATDAEFRRVLRSAIDPKNFYYRSYDGNDDVSEYLRPISITLRDEFGRNASPYNKCLLELVAEYGADDADPV